MVKNEPGDSHYCTWLDNLLPRIDSMMVFFITRVQESRHRDALTAESLQLGCFTAFATDCYSNDKQLALSIDATYVPYEILGIAACAPNSHIVQNHMHLAPKVIHS